ncbi:dihydrolipoyl dehydrogenase [Candidatus Margulisiibacteriota bacterium]
MSIEAFDIVVVGAGPGGYTAAIRAAQLGKKVALIEKSEVGGTCLNHGCIPTKTLHASTKLYSKIKKADKFGINAENVSINLEKIIERKDRIVSQLRKGLEYLFKENKIALIKGEGILKDAKHIEVAGRTIHAEKIILATGSRVSSLPGFELDGKKILSSDDILKIKNVPKSLAVIGAGPMGIELGCVFNDLGAKVTVFEIMPRIMPLEDEEVCAGLAQVLAKKGMEIKTNTSLKDTGSFDMVLISVGRKLNTEGFDKIGIKLEKGKVIVNDKMETNLPGIYAIGDIAGKYMFAHTAAKEGIVAAENASGKKAKMEHHAVPRCIYSDPAVASVGLNEKEAREKLKDIKIGKFPFRASSKSLINDERDGFIKIITDKSDKIVGIHILGGDATEIFGEAGLAVSKQMKAEDIINTIHAHPTVYESMYEAAENVLKQSISILNK